MARGIWILGGFAVALSATVALADLRAVPKQFVGDYVGTYTRGGASHIVVKLRKSGRTLLRITNPRDRGSENSTRNYWGKVSESGAFSFDNLTDPHETFVGQIAAGSLSGKILIEGALEGTVIAERVSKPEPKPTPKPTPTLKPKPKPKP